MPANPEKLPLWRRIAGIGVLGGFVAVIGLMTPVYVDDMRLHRYVVSLEDAPGTAGTPDETILSEVVARAHELDLPVKPGDVHLVHSGGKLRIEMKYVVQMNLVAYPVDLHFPTIR
jgi:hypothetical protein